MGSFGAFSDKTSPAIPPQLSDQERWGSEVAALHLLEDSPLIRVRIPERFTSGAGESLSRYRLRQFRREYPKWFHEDQYQLA